MKFIIISTEFDKPKVLGADIAAKKVLESQGNGYEVMVYKTDQVREVKKLSIEAAIKHLEEAAAKSGYTTTYATNFRDAGV